MNKNSEMVKMLLRYGFKPNIENHDGRRPIFAAFKNKDFETVKILIKYFNKEELHIKDDFGRDALYFSVLNERLDLINSLIHIYGVKINYQSVLEAAIHANNFNLFLNFYFNKTLDQKIESNFLLSLSILLNNNIKIIEILLNDEETKINIKPENTRAITHYFVDIPLIEATTNGNKKAIDQLLKKGAKINLGQEYQPFTIAVKNGNLEIAYFLKEHGADVTFIGSDGLDASNLYVNYLKNLYKKHNRNMFRI
ncbi:MAG TPA: ankyrin repeat domain-containing protein [Rickettsia endosymbiont of Columbicola hoogstraali]|nr:ankyrin repeat domain-containing protein [Rickettsia endosymbiont of Columbicola hoogstraali]